MTTTVREWFKSGDPWIWLNAGAVSVSIVMVAGLIGLIAWNGLGHFWPDAVAEFHYTEPGEEQTIVIGEISDSETVSAARAGLKDHDSPYVDRLLIKTGNRDYLGIDFRWVTAPFMGEVSWPEDIMVVERREWGNLYGYLKGMKKSGTPLAIESDLWKVFKEHLAANVETYRNIKHIEKDLIGAINYDMEQLRIAERGLELRNEKTAENMQALTQQRAELQQQYNTLTTQLTELYKSLNQYSFVADIGNGKQVEVSLAKVVRVYQPNNMNIFDRIGFYFEKIWEFAADDPREANTEGGIFPAIFGTVLMVIIMAIIVTPFGVVAAVYLHEYAKQGVITRTIRIAVNNLAGVPSIVYGVFGLGFFVYFLGGSIDQLFYPEVLPAPTFGTPGLIWASLTLALLTVPVVIVATEEGLSRVPRSIREGSLALGATKAETLYRTVLPMTASAMMTGLILAIARAAGEVAPLMLVGVVKLAPSLPLDGNYPFLHLDRKFMHLGFHIYDVGFQSPNVEAARPLVYATALLLVAIIVILNLTAIRIRNRLREKYREAEQH